jgi:PAS domain S-box-containing protein
LEYPVQKADRFRELIEGLNVITYEYHLGEKRFIYVSRMAESILGYPAEIWTMPKFWYYHLHPDDRDWAAEFSKHHTRLIADHEYEYRMIAQDGSIKWIKDITTVNTEKGVPVTLQGVLIDMTDRKKTEAELLKTKDRYQTLVEQQTEMITRWLPDGKFTYVNDVFCKFFGKTRDELIGKGFVPEMPKEDIERFAQFFRQLDKDNPVGQFTHRIIRPDGEIRWLKWTDTAIFDNSGNITEYQTVGRDITARKNAEEALMQSEAQLQLVFYNAPIGMAITDLTKKYLRVNKAYCDIVGYSKNELLGMSFEEITHPEDQDADKDIFNKAVAGINSNLNFEKRYIHKTGRVVFVDVHLNVLKDSAGKPNQRIAQVVDIT